MANQTLQVQGMSCQHCVKSVEGALQTLGASGKVNLGQGTVEVSYDETKVTIDKIKEAIEEQGYDVN
jgi:copper chaperone